MKNILMLKVGNCPKELPFSFGVCICCIAIHRIFQNPSNEPLIYLLSKLLNALFCIHNFYSFFTDLYFVMHKSRRIHSRDSKLSKLLIKMNRNSSFWNLQ